MVDDAPSAVRRRRATATDTPAGDGVAVVASAATEVAAATAATSASDSAPGLVPVLRPKGLQLSPVQGLQVVLQEKDNAGVLSQFIFFSIAVAALPVAVFFLVRRSLSPAPGGVGVGGAEAGSLPQPSALVTALVAAAPRLLTASRVPSLVAALAAVLVVNVVTGAFVLRALVEDARLVADVGGPTLAAGVASAEAAAAGATSGGEEGEGGAAGTRAEVGAATGPPLAVTRSPARATPDVTPL